MVLPIFFVTLRTTCLSNSTTAAHSATQECSFKNQDIAALGTET